MKPCKHYQMIRMLTVVVFVKVLYRNELGFALCEVSYD